MRLLFVFATLLLTYGPLQAQSYDHFYTDKSHTFYENGHEITSYMDPDRFISPTMEDIWKDEDGQLWIANLDNIFRYDGFEFTHMNLDRDKKILSLGRQYDEIFRDSHGNVWTTRMGGGIGKYNPRTKTYSGFKIDSMEHGLGRQMFDIVEDKYGNIWIGSQQGLVRIPNGNPKEAELIGDDTVLPVIKPIVDKLNQKGSRLAAILSVPNDTLIHRSFEVKEDQSEVLLLGLGQTAPSKNGGFVNKWLDFGWITDQKGDTLWKMDLNQTLRETAEALAIKDQIILPKGSYQLHYQTNRSYAFNDWNWTYIYTDPPSIPAWYGIQVLLPTEEELAQIDSVWTHHPENSGFHIYDSHLFKEKNETIWVAGTGGLQRLVLRDRQHFHFENILGGSLATDSTIIEVYTVRDADQNHLWISYRKGNGSPKIGLLHKDSKQLKEIKLGVNLVTPAFHMVQDHSGALWFGELKRKGVHRLSPPFIEVGMEGKPHITSFLGDEGQLGKIKALELDDYGNLWIGTWSHYIHKLKLDPSPIHFIETDIFGVDTINYMTVFKGSRNKLWLNIYERGNYGNPYLVEYDLAQKSFQTYRGSFKGIEGRDLIVLDELSNGKILLSISKSFILYDPEKDTIEQFPADQVRLHYTSAKRHFLLNDSILVVNGSGKLYHITQNRSVGSVKDYLKNISGNPARAYAEVTPHDHDSFWARIASGQLGRFRWAGKELEPLSIINTYSSPRDFWVDKNHRLWQAEPHLATDVQENGFQTIISDNSLSRYMRDGRLYDDKDGKIWFLGARGAVKYDPYSGAIQPVPSLDPLLLDRFKYVRRFDDGSVSIHRRDDINVSHYPHLYHFYPDSIKPDTIPPNLAFQGLQVQGTDTTEMMDLSWFETEHSFEFQYDRNSLNIQYRGIHFNYPKGVRYQYRLQGSSNESWIDGQDKREASFFDLAPGQYTFSVKAANSDGYWSKPKSLKFTILPPWYLSWWAKTIYALLTLGAIAYYVRYNRQQLEVKEAQLLKEQQLNGKLQQADKLKDEFLANTSHELRTPLNGIIGLSDSLIDGIGGKQSDISIHNLNLISSSGRRLANLVNDILDFSKLRNQDLELQLKPVDLYASVDVVLTLSQPLAQGKALTLQNDIPRDNFWVHADENRLQQILHNLVGNAIKFTEAGTVRVYAEEKEGKMWVHVSDTGIGIAQNQMERIFESFQQADGSTARMYGGTGLGLTVSRQLVELHGGNMKVSSEEGKGSTFSFSLPLSEKGLTATAPAQSQVLSQPIKTETLAATPAILAKPVPTHSGNFRVLIVDDEAVNRQVLQNHLQLQEFEVVQASSGMQALDILRDQPSFDLIILDIMMPQMSGYEVCAKLREMFPPQELPVVMLTAKNRVSDLVEGFGVGANDYLTKPFNKEELLSRIKTHLELSQISKAYGRFVPHNFMELLGRESAVYAKLGDQVQEEMSVLFADIRSYTTLSEEMGPEDNFRFINAYLRRVGPCIQQQGGFVNQFLGDGIMAIFPNSPADALKAAVDMQKAITLYNQERITKGRPPIRTGIGLHAGPLMLGIIGDQNRHDTGIIADTVNTAARLEGLTKWFGASVLLSKDALDQAVSAMEKPFSYRYLGNVQVKGKSKFIAIYECLDGESEAIQQLKMESLSMFEQALKAYLAQEFIEAASLFKQVLAKNPKDKAADFYLRKAAEYMVKAPEEGWEGTIRMDHK